MSDKIVALLDRNEELLTVLVKGQLSEVVEKELASAKR